MTRTVITQALPKRFHSCGLCTTGGYDSGFFSLAEFVEEAASLRFIDGVPPFNEREPVGPAESGNQDIPLTLPQRALRVARARDPGSEVGVYLGAIFGGEGKPVEHWVAVLIEPEPVPECVDRLAAGAEMGKDALAGLAVDAFAFDKLGNEHAATSAVAANPLDVHTLWIPENGAVSMRSWFEDELITALVAVALLPTLWWATRLAWRTRRRKRHPMSFLDVIETARGKKES